MSADPQGPAGEALALDVVAAEVTARTPVSYDPYLAGRSVERATGTATVPGGEVRTWSAIVKRTTGTGLRAARRELAAYREGIATAAADSSLRAPALLGWDEGPEHVEVWLEELVDEHAGRWPLTRFGLAARHIAGWDAAMRTAPAIPGFDFEDAWAERHGQPHRLSEAVEELESLRTRPAAEELMAILPDAGFARTRAMITSTGARIERLAELPQILLHHDLVRSNLFALPGSGTAAIDWENVGRGPAGVNLAPLVVGSVRRGEAAADELADLEEVVLSNYEQALAAAGVDSADVRSAYRLALGLRWHVVLGTISAWLDPTVDRIRGSRPAEPRPESLRHLVELSRHLLAAAEPR